MERYGRTRAVDDLQRAITLGKEALEATSLDHINRTRLLSNLATGLSSRYECTGSIDDLQQAITLGEEALKATPLDHPDRAGRLNNLASRLSLRYQRTGAIDDLQQAITLGQEAVEAIPMGHPDRVALLDNLSNSLSDRYRRTEFIDDLQQAITLQQEAVELIPSDHPNRARRLSNLANKLSDRYEHIGLMDDLKQAVNLGQEALRATPLDHPDRATFLSNLASRLLTRYERIGAIDDIQQAITLGQDAVEATPLGHPDRSRSLVSPGSTFRSRYLKMGSISDLNECHRILQEALDCITSPPSFRIYAACKAANVLAKPSRWEESSSLLEGAVRLLPKLSPLSLERGDRQYMLSNLSGLAGKVASVTLQAGRGGYYAIKLLELSCGVIMGLTIDCRDDLHGLKSTNFDLFGKFNALRIEIDTPLVNNSGERDTRYALSRRATAIDEMEATLQHTRQLPGHEGFQHPPSEEDLMNMAKDGFIVVVNSTIHRSDAIIVTSSSIKALPLPDLDSKEASDRLVKIPTLINGPLRTHVSRNKEMSQIFLWLWDVAVEPVLQELQLTANPDAEAANLPHIWWGGVGQLSRAPFHAAGDHSPKSTRNTLSYAISSYTPTIKALPFSREKKFSLLNSPGTRLLIVTMAETPSHAPLRQVEEKAEEIYKLTISTTHLRQPSAVQVLKQLRSYNAVHLACHGTVDNKDPSGSHLLLLKDDGSNTVDNMTVGEVSETIHIASAFQLAGINHILATMWNAHTQTCKEVSTNFYSILFDGQASFKGHQKVGMALHLAIKKAREKNRGQPLRWAPFIHMGA